MAIPSKWAIQEIFELYLFDLSTGASKGYLTDLKQTNLTQDGTTVYATGGSGNPKLVPFDHSKSAMLECQSALYENGFIGSVLGATPVVGANTDIYVPDILTVQSDAAITTYTALGTAGSEIKFAYETNTDGSLSTTSYEQDSVVSSGKFTYTPGTKTIAFNGGDVANGTEIIVWYNATADANTVTLTSYTNQFSSSVKMVAKGLIRDVCTDVDYAVQIIFNKGKISNSFNIETLADGEAAIHNFEIEALKPCNNRKLYDIILYDPDTIV